MGAAAKMPIGQYKAYLFLPYTMTINLPVAKNSEIGFLFEKYPYWYSGHSGANDNILWTFMIYERLKGPNSFWYPYFSIVRDFDLLSNWSAEELAELHDPVLVFDTQRWLHRQEKVWKNLEEVFVENPDLFPASAPLKEIFDWAWKLTTTRSFAQEGGMVIPMADNMNHSIVNIEYECKTKEQLLTETDGQVDYSDFTGAPPRAALGPSQSRYQNKLDRYLGGQPDKAALKSAQNLWEVDALTRGYQSDSDEETVRNYGDVASEDDPEEEEEDEEIEELKTVEELQDKYFVMRTDRDTAFKQGS